MPAETFGDPASDPRLQPTAPTRGERACLDSYLEHYRSTVELKLAGLDAEQLARRSVPPSTLSLLGLLRHLAKVEHVWNVVMIQGRPEPKLYGCDEVRDADFDGAVDDDAVVVEAWASWRREVAAAREHLATVSLDHVVHVHGEPTEVRDIVVHLIEEYARHAGHIDLLRECVDGAIGQ
ncbi:DinB family protein [Nocardioides acrostichi]|uniref:DUF664 domain-containing protein n=1 Tax=Nocardioides acrostichi TaxID=2784339 RepID=A0A930YBE2_9ACTN|nr:DinB family protein [Nocardioides acrostichi]MBF4162383.1 DUF664 domain-containing protein [Nocardioides acrostichi]